MWGDSDALPALGQQLPASAGLVPRVVADVLAALPQRAAAGREPSLRMSVVEIFGDTVSDLLNDSGAIGAWHGVAARAVAKGLADVVVEDTAHAAALLRLAEDAKRRAATEMNERSSRAHCLLMLSLVQRAADGSTVRATLTLADLGGCELLKKSKATGERLQEAVNINLGLLALKNVIIALHQGRSYVPFQDDKLTMLLAPSLGGRGRSVVIVTGRPEAAHATETLQALRFAQTCGCVELSAQGGWSEVTAAAALRTIDSQIDAVQREIARKERWETRVVRRRDERAGLAAGMAGLDGAYKTDMEYEEVKVSGLFGAEAEHEELERLLQARRELVGAE
eukprot:466423-Prymnesium_polylepis.1